MDIQTIIFFILGLFILVNTILSVTTKSVIRATTYLLFVLFGTGGLYFLLGYTFLGAVQIMVYAGGIVVLYVFSILLTTETTDSIAKVSIGKKITALISCLVGLAVVLFIIFSHKFTDAVLGAPSESLTSIDTIGTQMLSAGKYGFLLPFEAVSILLLACIVGGLIIARKR